MQTQNNQPPAPTLVPTDKARQGVTGHNVHYVLVFWHCRRRDRLRRGRTLMTDYDPAMGAMDETFISREQWFRLPMELRRR